MTNILQVLLGLALVNYLLFDVVIVAAKPTVTFTQLRKALAIAGTTAAVFLLTLISSASVEQFVLSRFIHAVLPTLVFIAILAAVISGAALVLAGSHFQFIHVPGIFLPLIFANCVVMAVIMPAGGSGIELVGMFVSGLARCAGFALVLGLFTVLRERLAGADMPLALRGAPTTLVTAALLSMTFMGFAGLA